MSKNTLYGIIAIVVIVIIVGAAVAVYYRKPQENKPESKVKNPDTYIYDTIGDPQTLDPAVAYDDASYLSIWNVYETLVTVEKDNPNNIVPCLATSWESDSTGKIWTFHLRKGVKFSNGDPFDAYAVKYSFDRVLIMNTTTTGVTWIFAQEMYTYNATTGKWNSPDGESSVRIVDNYTVKFVLKKPYAGFLQTIAFLLGAIVDPKVVEAHGGVVPNQDNQWMSEHMVGTGPYKFVEWKHNQYIKLEYNPNYWGGWEGKHVKYIIIRNIPEVATREQELLKGDADMAYIPVNHLSDVQGKEGIHVETGDLTFSITLIQMNCREKYKNETNPLHNKLVRQAISYAIDYKAIINDVYMGYAIQLQGIVPKGMFGHDDNLFMYHRDVNRAKELLKEAGYENGFKVTLMYNQGNDVRAHIAQIVKENLADIGISVEVQELAWPTLLDKLWKGDYSMSITGWIPDYNDPDDYAFALLASQKVGGDQFATGWVNETVDKLLIKAKFTTDKNERLQLYYEAQEIAIKDPSFVYLAQLNHVVVYRTWLHGYYYNPVKSLQFYYLYKE